MYFLVSLCYFAVLNFLVKKGSVSKGWHDCISVCSRRFIVF